MKHFILCLFILTCIQSKLFPQKLSIGDLLHLHGLSLNEMDSLMQLKKFSKFDTAAGNLQFKFYRFSSDTNNEYEINYLQIAVKEEYNYPEIQFQTTIQKQAQQLQQQLLTNGFEKTDSTSSIRYSKNDMQVYYSVEKSTDPTSILYTFIFRQDQTYPDKPINSNSL